MKKITFFLSMLLCFMLGAVTAHAQIWVDGDGSAALGTKGSSIGGGYYQYTYHSGEFTAPSNIQKLRLVFLATNTNYRLDGYSYVGHSHGRHPFVNFAEFYLYDANGNRVALTASNFSSNATEPTEGGLDQLCNDVTSGDYYNHDWFWHSMCTTTPNCDHYLEITVPDGTDLSTFSYGYVSRWNADVPSKIMLIAGNDNLAAHDELNTIEQKFEKIIEAIDTKDVSLSPEDNALRVLAATKTAFGNGNTDLSELNRIVSDLEQIKIHTLSIASSELTDASNPNRKVYDGSGSTFKIPAGTSKVRMTVTETNNGHRRNGHVFFTLSELKVYIDGKALDLSAANLTTNADQNTLGMTHDGNGLPALYDGDYNTYFHSAYENAPAADHYIDFYLPSALTADGTMSISFDSRNHNNVPTEIAFCFYPVSVALCTRVDELFGSVNPYYKQYYDVDAMKAAADAALAVLYNSASTTEELDAALAKLNSDAENAVILFADNTKVMLGNKQYANSFVAVNPYHVELCHSDKKDNYAYVWTLKRVGARTYKFYNEYADKYIGAVGTHFGQFVREEADALVLTVAPSSEGYFNIYDATFNPQDDSALHNTDGGGVVHGNFDDDASQYSFITDITADCKAFDDALIANVNNMVGTEKIGQWKSMPADVQAAITTLQNNSSVENYKNLEALAVTTAGAVLPEAGKIYQIVSQTLAYEMRNPGDLMYANPVAAGADRFTASTDLLIKHTVTYGGTDTKATLNVPDSYWQFEKATDAQNLVYVRNLNSGLYIGQLPSNNHYARLTLSKDDAGQYSFTYLPEHDSNMLYDTKGGRFLNNTVDHKEIVGYDVVTDDASRWTIEEVTSVPVRIGTVKHATLHLPFAVRIPANVEAYVGKEENPGVIDMEPLSGVIPANTPVVLVTNEELTEAKTYDFEVAYGDATEAPANVLSGTTTAETIADNAVAYILKKNKATGVGFYKVNSATDRTIPANKAYFGSTVAATLAPAMYSFRFGEQTSIEGVNAVGNENESYYDLNGRRVLYPAHGVFVKSNGQKVYIK